MHYEKYNYESHITIIDYIGSPNILHQILFCGKIPVMHGGVSPSDYMLLEMYCVIDFWCNYLVFTRACSLSHMHCI